ncbi:hypothetical protein EVB56_014 [Rhizobium phage RHph_Y1_10]|nr:hypothetical protein EVB56_014 [Rhizobium phage RHph_Y1_10]
MDMLEQTGEEVIKQAVDRIDNARDELDRIARALNELGIGAGGNLFAAWREIVGGISEARRGLRMLEALKENTNDG